MDNFEQAINSLKELINSKFNDLNIRMNQDKEFNNLQVSNLNEKLADHAVRIKTLEESNTFEANQEIRLKILEDSSKEKEKKLKPMEIIGVSLLKWIGPFVCIAALGGLKAAGVI